MARRGAPVGFADTPRLLTLTLALLLGAATAWGQAARGEPYVGYVYPAGSRQGATVRVTAGGQNLQGVNAVCVTGTGVRAKVVEHVRPLTRKQLGDVAQHLRLLMRQKWAEATGRPAMAPGTMEKQEQLEPLPDHPWLRDLDKKSLHELDELRQKLFDPKQQPNAQIAEWALLDVTVDPGAAPGVRELRLITPQGGLTNPVRLHVGALAEVSEREPNNPDSAPGAALTLPVLINGQIMPGDVDRFRFQARRGQKLVMEAQARSLIPYLADAVPGWFQATLSLYDSQGKEVAFDDDYRFSPDPVLLYQVPQDGDYALQICDAIYRGREDFVYRLSVTEQPFATRMFPLGGRAGATATAQISGWNLPPQQLQLDTTAGPETVRETAWRGPQGTCNPLHYAVDDLPESVEAEPNDTTAAAQKLALPLIVNGRIGKPGDVDTVRFEGRAGEEIVAEVHARRLDSPLDSLLRVMDSTGKVLALNDDHEDKGTGWLTHHADSVLSLKLPKAGAYTVSIVDAQQHGGEEYAYRLRLSAPRPDFALRLTPSSVSLFAGRSAPITVYALRQDGFAGEIEIAVTEAPTGFVIAGGRIPAGRDRLHMTLTAPMTPLDQPLTLRLEGRAKIGEQAVSRPVVPAEDMMQAFIYRQLVPCQSLTALIMSARRFAPMIQLADKHPIRLPAGGKVQLQLTSPPNPMLRNVRLDLREPPEGVTISSMTQVGNGFTLVLQADAKTARVGTTDNLIVSVTAEVEFKGQDGKAKTFRSPLGCLPAIPCEIVKS